MTKSLIVSGILIAALAAPLAGQITQKYGVTVTPEKNVDYSKWVTYSWTRGQPSSVKAIDAQIVSAVDKELAGLGMSPAKSGSGDVLVSYGSLARTDVDVKAKPNEKGLKPEYPVGTLVVVFLDPSSRRRLLQMRTDKPIDSTEPAQITAAINSAVAEMFQSYPTRKKR